MEVFRDAESKRKQMMEEKAAYLFKIYSDMPDQDKVRRLRDHLDVIGSSSGNRLQLFMGMFSPASGGKEAPRLVVEKPSDTYFQSIDELRNPYLNGHHLSSPEASRDAIYETYARATAGYYRGPRHSVSVGLYVPLLNGKAHNVHYQLNFRNGALFYISGVLGVDEASNTLKVEPRKLRKFSNGIEEAENIVRNRRDLLYSGASDLRKGYELTKMLSEDCMSRHMSKASP